MKFEVKGGFFGYTKEAPILNQISFSISSGQIVAILGPNGSGKTTLLRATIGLLKWQSGESLLDGKNIRTMSSRDLFRRLAYVPQARSASSALTVLQAVLLGRSGQINMFSSPKASDLLIAENTMQALGISHLKQTLCNCLSGGELQLVLIARALTQQPELLILDEPESNLDFKNQLVVLDTITALKKHGLGCLFNTHYPAHALQRADMALLLFRDGSYRFGPAKQIVTEENIAKAFGVRSAICRIETEDGPVSDVVPLSVLKEDLGL